MEAYGSLKLGMHREEAAQEIPLCRLFMWKEPFVRGWTLAGAMLARAPWGLLAAQLDVNCSRENFTASLRCTVDAMAEDTELVKLLVEPFVRGWMLELCLQEPLGGS